MLVASVMKSLYGHSLQSPYHLSVGVVLVDDQRRVACHYFQQIEDGKTKQVYRDFYILMRETVEPNETLEQAVARGLKEEFGAKGRIIDFLGSQTIVMPRDGYEINKTTLYFLVRLDTIDPSKRLSDDPERGSQIQWYDIAEMIEKMSQQKGKDYRADMNEAEILERALSQLKYHN